MADYRKILGLLLEGCQSPETVETSLSGFLGFEIAGRGRASGAAGCGLAGAAAGQGPRRLAGQGRPEAVAQRSRSDP